MDKTLERAMAACKRHGEICPTFEIRIGQDNEIHNGNPKLQAFDLSAGVLIKSFPFHASLQEVLEWIDRNYQEGVWVRTTAVNADALWRYAGRFFMPGYPKFHEL